MRKFVSLGLGLALTVSSWSVSADPWKHENGKERWRYGYERDGYGRGESERKVKFRTSDGCEVERKWKKGEYEEKVKCKPRRYSDGY